MSLPFFRLGLALAAGGLALAFTSGAELAGGAPEAVPAVRAPSAPAPAATSGATIDPSLLLYAQECERKIGPIPSFDCADGVLAPITVGGKVPAAYTPGMDCDRPSLLPPGEGEKTDGQCVPNSRALVLRDDGKVQISVFCRQRLIRPAGTTLYDELDVVQHSVETGSTCWYRAKRNNPNGDPEIGVSGSRVPPPNSPAGATFWNEPEVVAAQNCGACHDSDPFYYSPYIAQTGRVPSDPLGKYANDIGRPFQAWPKPLALSTRGNTCTGCHRIGSQHTCATGMYQSTGQAHIVNLDAWGESYPRSHWMPVENQWTEAQWKVIYEQSVKELGECCKNPSAPGCIAEPIEAGAAVPGRASGR